MPREDLPARYRRWTYKKTFLWQPKKAGQQRRAVSKEEQIEGKKQKEK